MTTVRWTCPNSLHPGVLGPSKPRRDNICRYCFACSEKAGKLVERVVPKLEAKRQSRKERAAEKAKAERAKASEERKNKPITQADVPTIFRCGSSALGVIPFHWSALKPIIEVRTVKAPRTAKRDGKRIVIYDHGGDKWDAQAMVFCALMTLHYACNTTRLRKNCERFLKVRPRLDDFKNAWLEVAHLLRSREAMTMHAGRSNTMGRKAS